MFKKILEEEHLAKFKSILNAEVYADTKYYQKIYKFQIGNPNDKEETHNNEADAFKHTFGSAWLSLKYNKIISFSIGYLHELEGRFDMNQSDEEEIMDTHNNKEGRKIAEEIKKYYPNWEQLPERKIKDIIAKKVMQKMNNGFLIKSPNDVKNNEKEAMLQKFLKMYSDYQRQNMKEYIENMLFNNFSENQQNLKSQSEKPLNMNFAGLIKQPQALAPQNPVSQNEQFNIPQVALKAPSLKYNYGQNKTANNKMQFQNEKMPSLYRGSAVKPQQLSQGGGRAVLNSTNNSPIKEVQYNNLPEFKPMNVKLEKMPVMNFGTTNYKKGGVSSNSGGMFDISQILQLGMKLLESYQSD